MDPFLRPRIPFLLNIFDRLDSLLALDKDSHYEVGSSLISQLISAFELKDDPDSRSNQLTLYAATKKLLDLALSFETSHSGSPLRDFLHHINGLRSEAQIPGHPQGNVQILLSGLFLFVTAEGIDNREGKDTLPILTPQYIDGLKNDQNIKVYPPRHHFKTPQKNLQLPKQIETLTIVTTKIIFLIIIWMPLEHI